MVNIEQTLYSDNTNDLKYMNIKTQIDELFKGNEMDQNDFNQLLNDLKEKEMINYFCSYLNLKRCEGQFELTKETFTQLKEIIESIMKNITNIEDNYNSIRYCLILTQTYYYSNGNEKVYISNSFKYIDMFKQREFWEYFFAKNLSKELLVMKNKSQKLKENVVFSNLLSLVHNMTEVKVQKIIIKDLINVLGKQYVLKEQMNNEIMMLVENYKDEDTVQLLSSDNDNVNEEEGTI